MDLQPCFVINGFFWCWLDKRFNLKTLVWEIVICISHNFFPLEIPSGNAAKISIESECNKVPEIDMVCNWKYV